VHCGGSQAGSHWPPLAAAALAALIWRGFACLPAGRRRCTGLHGFAAGCTELPPAQKPARR